MKKEEKDNNSKEVKPKIEASDIDVFLEVTGRLRRVIEKLDKKQQPSAEKIKKKRRFHRKIKNKNKVLELKSNSRKKFKNKIKNSGVKKKKAIKMKSKGRKNR